MAVYQVTLRREGKLEDFVVEAPTWMQAGVKAKKEHGGSIADIGPLRDCRDVVEVNRRRSSE